MFFLNVFAAWMLADFIAGMVHWWEDRILGSPAEGFFAEVARDNSIHHINPELMGRHSPWESIKGHAWIAWLLSAISWALGAPLWFWLAFFFVSFGNLVHRYAHLPRNKVPTAIQFLQRTGLMISAAHHAGHHREGRKLIPKDRSIRRFCPMTDWLNPALDWIGFFSRLERLVRYF